MEPQRKFDDQDQNPQKVHFEDEERLELVRTGRNDGKWETYNSDDDDDEDYDEKVVDKKKKYGDAEDFQRPAKLELIVGFLRCFNFLSCATSLFSIALSLLFTLEENPHIIRNYWSVKLLFTFYKYFFPCQGQFQLSSRTEDRLQPDPPALSGRHLLHHHGGRCGHGHLSLAGVRRGKVPSSVLIFSVRFFLILTLTLS